MVESCKKKIAQIKSIHNNIYRIPEHFSLWKLLYKFTIIWQFSSPAFETPNQYHITFVSHCIENNTSLTVGYSQLDQVTVYELRILVPQAFKVILNNHCCYSWNWTQSGILKEAKATLALTLFCELRENCYYYRVVSVGHLSFGCLYTLLRYIYSYILHSQSKSGIIDKSYQMLIIEILFCF